MLRFPICLTKEPGMDRLTVFITRVTHSAFGVFENLCVPGEKSVAVDFESSPINPPWIPAAGFIFLLCQLPHFQREGDSQSP